MSESEPKPVHGRGPVRRLRAGLRRHGVLPRPPELRRRLRAADVRFTTGNAIEFYQDGRSGLSAMLEAIEGAAKHIHLETYIFRSDQTGARFLRALIGSRTRSLLIDDGRRER